jgi:hypothetical protein
MSLRSQFRSQEESASFLKKRSKKLSLTAGRGNGRANDARSKSFFGSPGGAPFFSKKEPLSSLHLTARAIQANSSLS